jgi:hypothetical protein
VPKDVYNLIKGFPGSIGQVIDGMKELAGLLAHMEWDECAKKAFPDEYRLATEWDKLSDYDRGYLAGRIVGQYGAGVIAGGAAAKVVKKIRDLRKAATVCSPKKTPVKPKTEAPKGKPRPPGQWDSGNYPRPPGWNPSWEWGPASGEAEAGWRWWDPKGGEWRWHPPDKWHPRGHWDYNPWEHPTGPWQNVPPGNCPDIK